MEKIIELSVSNFKAVKKASIALDGITVVAGINGCGKSSLSQLLYYSFYNANRYDELVNSLLYNSLIDYMDALKQIEREVKGEKNASMELTHVSMKDKNEYLLYVNDLTTRFLYYKDFVINSGDKSRINSYNRVVRIIQDVLHASSDKLEWLLEHLSVQIRNMFDQAIQFSEERYYPLLRKHLNFCLKNELPQKWEIKEYGVPFVGTEIKVVPVLHYIKRVAYIDTPMMIGIPMINSKNHWIDLTRLLNKTLVNGGENQSLYANLSQIMNGESVVEEDGIRDSKLSYKRNDGKIFDLKECATGIKSFSILQLLLKNGFHRKIHYLL